MSLEDKTIAVVGVSDEETAHLRLLMRRAAAELGHAWKWGSESNADLLVVDPSSFSGQMARTRAQSGGMRCAIFSDDLSMEAARQGGTLTEAATAALDAGCDMVLICNQPEEAGKVLDALRVKPSKASRRRIKRMRPRGKAPIWDKLVDEPEYRQAQALLRDAFA